MNGSRLIEVDKIKNAIFDHLQNQFSSSGKRPIPENMTFNRLEDEDNLALVREFST